MSLEGKVALVTGAGRGIGFDIAARLHTEGATVVFNDLKITEAVKSYTKNGSARNKALFHQADVSQFSEVKKMIDRIVSELNTIDILVNNAGVDPASTFLKVTEDLWNHVIDTNLKATFFCSQKAAEKMCSAGHGRIVNISSVHSFATMPGFSVYAASKGAINSLTRELALELAPLGITVNAVAPGAIEVERFVNNPVYDRQALAKEIPSRRVGAPNDVSAVVSFLCSDEASWLTGQVISIDGGTLTRLFLYAGRAIPSGEAN